MPWCRCKRSRAPPSGSPRKAILSDSDGESLGSDSDEWTSSEDEDESMFGGSSRGSSDDDSDKDDGGSKEAVKRGTAAKGTAILSKDEKIAQLMAKAMVTQRQKVLETSEIVIFLSSTFNGMRDEREIFTNRYLPMLKSKAGESGVRVKMFDMRWGITVEQSNNHETLKICMNGVVECNIFIGFYGARYGSCYVKADPDTHWVQAEFPMAEDAHPWVMTKINRNRAVTELEFRGGWLNDPGCRPACYFFRDAEWDREQIAKMAAMSPEELKEYGDHPRHYQNKHAPHDKALRDLQKECETISETYTYYAPGEFAQQSYEKISKWIEQLLPSLDSTEMATEDAAHKAFATARCTMWISDVDQVSELRNQVMQSKKQLTVVHGPSGGGKSALIANFLVSYREKVSNKDNSPVIYHFIGSTARSSSLGHTLRRLIYHLNMDIKKDAMPTEEQMRALEDALPDADSLSQCIRDFHVALRKRCDKQAKRKTNVVLVLDALTQLNSDTYRDEDGVQHSPQNMQWLFQNERTPFPANLRIILCTLQKSIETAAIEDKSLAWDSLQQYAKSTDNLEFMHTYPLSKGDRNIFCKKMLDNAGKSLKENQLRQVVYGEAYLIPKKMLKTKKGQTPPAIYFVKDAEKYRVNGKYVESEDSHENAKIYIKTDDSRFRLQKQDGIWILMSTSNSLPIYKCPHGTDTPPSLNWTPAESKVDGTASEEIKVRCLQPPTQNPLFLKLAMEELIAFGVFELLNEKIKDIASCGSIPTLLLLMLDRLENGVGGDAGSKAEGRSAVISIFSQIWCSKNGMMEQELCDLVRLESVNSIEWNILFTPIKPFLVSRRGRYVFVHNYIKQAVKARYCPTKGHRWAVASAQFDYFYEMRVNAKDGGKRAGGKVKRAEADISLKRADEELLDLSRFVDNMVLNTANELDRNDKLNFAGNKVGPDVAMAIGQGLGGNNTLVELDLSGNNILDVGCKEVAGALKDNKTLKKLNLADNGIGFEGAKELRKCLQKNKTLVWLSVSENKIPKEGAKAIAAGIQGNATLRRLFCGANNFQTEGSKWIARALHKNVTIVELSMNLNEMGDDGAKEFGNALQHNEVLQKLYLGENNIGDIGCFSLFDACKANTTIKVLHINHNKMSVQGATAVADLLLNCPSLEDLNIQSNELGHQGMVALSPALVKNKTLTHLNLSHNNLYDAGARVLGEALEKNSTLLVLELVGNFIGDSGIHTIAKSLHFNDATAVQRMLKQHRMETGYLKQWKNRKQRDTSEDDDGTPSDSKKTTLTIEMLSAKLRTSEARQGMMAKAANKRSVKKPLLSATDGADLLSRMAETVVAGGAPGAPEAPEAMPPAGHGKKGKGKRTSLGGHDFVGQGTSKQSAIRSLFLQENTFGYEGAKSIGEALRSNNAIKNLYLSNNELTDQGCEALFDDLKFNGSLEHLEVRECQLGDQAGAQFKDTFEKQASLTFLDISMNPFGGDLVKHLGAGLEKAKTPKLETLVIYTPEEMSMGDSPKLMDRGLKRLGQAMLENNEVVLKEIVYHTEDAELKTAIDAMCQINAKWNHRLGPTDDHKNDVANREKEKKKLGLKKHFKKPKRVTQAAAADAADEADSGGEEDHSPDAPQETSSLGQEPPSSITKGKRRQSMRPSRGGGGGGGGAGRGGGDE